MFGDCNYPKGINFLLTLNAGLFLYMFGMFYYNSYVKSRRSTPYNQGNKKEYTDTNGITKNPVANGNTKNPIANGNTKNPIANGNTKNPIDNDNTTTEVVTNGKAKECQYIDLTVIVLVKYWIVCVIKFCVQDFVDDSQDLEDGAFYYILYFNGFMF